MRVSTIEEAKAQLERQDVEVVRTTVHLPIGDRYAWFIGQAGWVALVNDDAIIRTGNLVVPHAQRA